MRAMAMASCTTAEGENPRLLHRQSAASGELVHGLQGVDEVSHAVHAHLHALQHVRRHLALLQHALDVAEADHEVSQVVDHAGRELAHGSQPLHVQELGLRLPHLHEACVQLFGALGEQRHQPLDGAGLMDVIARVPDRLEDVVRLPRLLEETEDARAIDGGDQGGRIGEAGEHDAGHVRFQLAELFQQLHARHLGHALVGDDHVQVGGFRHLQRLLAGARLEDPVAALEEVAQDDQVLRLVIDDEDATAASLADAVLGDEIAQAVVKHGAASMGLKLW